MTKDDAWKLVEHWIAAWKIMTHYEDAIELTSPIAAQLLGTPAGKVNGKARFLPGFSFR